MEVLHAAPYKVLHLEYNEVKVLARLQKLVRKATPQMCCCFCRKFTLLFCSQGGREVPSTSLAGICHSISVRVSAPWLEGELCSLFIHAPWGAAVLVQWVHDKAPDCAFRLRRLRLCSRITPDECLGQPLRYLLHLLKNSRMRREICQLILSAVDLKRLGSVCL